MRGSQHDKQIREFTIDNHGMHIGEPFINVQNIILGNPSSQGVRDTEHLGRMFD
jgi:circadian clock protein KaiC